MSEMGNIGGFYCVDDWRSAIITVRRDKEAPIQGAFAGVGRGFVALRHIATQTYNGGLVKSEYEVLPKTIDSKFEPT